MRTGLGMVALFVALPLAAQEAAPSPTPPDSAKAPAPVAELVFEREVFQYPTYQRRNPFRPLVGNQGSGPRFEQVSLRGIIWSMDPKRSVALFGVGGTAQGGAAATPVGETKRLRVGESWGNMRVAEIQKDRVIVAVEEFGLSENKTLGLTRKRGGGGQ